VVGAENSTVPLTRHYAPDLDRYNLAPDGRREHTAEGAVTFGIGQLDGAGVS
jgi:hypothetical protein